MNHIELEKNKNILIPSLSSFVFFCLTSCTSPPPELIRSPSGPCWNVTLNDGFSSGDELVDTFSCLNNSHNFDAFVLTVEQLHTLDREQSPLKDNIAELVNQTLFSQQSQMFSILSTYLDQHPTITQNLTNIVRGTLYGKETPSSPFDFSIQEQGLIHPTLSLLPPLSQRILDHPEEKETIESFLFSEEAQELLCTVFGLIQNPNTQDIFFSMPQYLGRAIESTYDTSNDLWEQEQEHSALGFITTLVTEGEDTPAPLVMLAPSMENIVQDTRIRTPLKEILLEQLRPDLFPSIEYLIKVDRFGNTRTENTPSALYDILSIMEQSNAPLECSLSIFSFSISEISIDNLAVEFLTRIASESPETVDSALNLLNILDLGITDWMLDQIVDSEICPMLTQDFVSRFQALQRLDDPQVAPLLSIGLDIIKVFRHPTQSLLPDLANLMSTFQQTKLTEPAEEVLMDILDSDLLVEGIRIVPELDNLEAQCPTDIEPISYSTFLNQTATLLSEEHREELTSFATFSISQAPLWNTYERIPNVMKLSGMEHLVSTIHSLDLYTIDQSIPSIQTRDLIYKTLESTALVDEILRHDAQTHTPLTWTGQLFIDETPDQLLSLFMWLDERLSILGNNE